MSSRIQVAKNLTKRVSSICKMKIAKASLFLVLCINAKNIYNCIQCVPQNTTTEITTTKPTTALNSTDFADRIQLKEGFNFIAAREAYFNFDGKKNAVMNFKYALVKGVLYAFGGTPDYKQVINLPRLIVIFLSRFSNMKDVNGKIGNYFQQRFKKTVVLDRQLSRCLPVKKL